MLFGPSGSRLKRQKKGEKRRFRPIFGKEGQTPLKPPFPAAPDFGPAVGEKVKGNTMGGNRDRESPRGKSSSERVSDSPREAPKTSERYTGNED